MGDSDASLTHTQWKLWLFFVRSQSTEWRKVSMNILREVCKYLGRSVLLPCIVEHNLRLHDLDTGKVRSVTLSTENHIMGGVVFCFISESQLLFVGLSSSTVNAFSLDIQSNSISQVPCMNTKRSWPGLVRYRSTAYVFGGNINPILTSYEEWVVGSSEWSQLPDMQKAKSAFSPCVVEQEIYLCGPTDEVSEFEVFTPRTKTFRQYPVSVVTTLYGSVAFLVDDTMLILTIDERLISWRLGDAAFKEEAICLRDINSALSSVTPVRVGNYVYWCNYLKGNLVKFDLLTHKVEEETI